MVEGLEWFDAVFGGGLDVGAGGCPVSGGLVVSECSADFVVEFGHAEVAFGLVVCERHVGCGEVAKNIGFLVTKSACKVVGEVVGFGPAV